MFIVKDILVTFVLYFYDNNHVVFQSLILLIELQYFYKVFLFLLFVYFGSFISRLQPCAYTRMIFES